MKNLFSRRKFLQAATVTASAAMLPSIQGCSSGSGNGKKEVIAGELPKRRLGRTNRMVSCIGFSFHVWGEAIKILGQNSLIGNVSGDDLVRWALRLPVSVANFGMDGYSPLESCVNIGKEPLISEAEAGEIEAKLNFNPEVTRLPYYTAKK